MVAFLVGPRTPAVGHAINALPVRPVVGGIRPVVPGLRASVVFAQGWQVRVANTTGVEATVLDAGDRPFLRLGPSGVFADFAAFSWYQSNTFDSPVRPPEGLRPDAAPDWHRVAVEPAWSWFDPRLKPDRSVLTDEILRSNLHADVGSWTIPLRYGETPGSINGRLQFEPFLGTYRHRLTGRDHPAPGVTVGLIGGTAVPTLTLDNASATTVTVVGAAGEPFARIGPPGGREDAGRPVVEVNVHSPTWVQAAQALGQSPTATADAAAPPQWRVVAEGSRWSWREFRNRPPDDEPLSGLVQKGRPFPVRHWAVPLLVGDKRVSVTGVTDFVPRAGTAPKRGSSVVPVVVGLGTFALAFVTVRRRRPGRSR